MGDHFDFLQVNSSCGVSFGSATCLAMCKLVNKKWEKKREGGWQWSGEGSGGTLPIS